MACQADAGLVELLVRLGEAEADEMIGNALAAPGEEGGDRDRRNARLGGDVAAKGEIVAIEAGGAEIGGQEIGAGRRQDFEPRRLQPGRQQIALARHLQRPGLQIVRVILQTIRDRPLKIGRRGERQELMGFREKPEQIGAAAMKPTFQPVRGKILPAEPMRTVRSRMPESESIGTCRRPSNTMCS